MKHNTLYLIVFGLILGLTACKYEDGPIVSIHSPENRVINTWVPKEATVNSVEDLSTQGGLTYIGLATTGSPWLREITFLKGGGCLAFVLWETEDMSFSGTWALTFNKNQIAIRTNNANNQRVDFDWNILHLGAGRLKVTYIFNGNLYEVIFVTKK